MNKEKIIKSEDDSSKNKIKNENSIIKNSKEKVKINEETYKEKYLKSIADMQNLRKMIEKEKLNLYKFKAASFIQEILPIIDMFETALKSKDVSDEIKTWLVGFEMILKNLKNSLASEGVKEIITKPGDKFNSKHHHAIEEKESNDVKNGHILEIKSKGYLIHDRLLRPASVVIAKNKNIKKEGN